MKTVNASQLPSEVSNGVAYYLLDEGINLEYTIATKQWSGVLMEFNHDKGDWQDLRELTKEEAIQLASEARLLKPKN